MEFAELIKTTRVDNVILRRQSSSLVEGTLCLTSHHLIFSSRVSEKDELMLLYMAIEDVQKKIAGYNGTINIICKDFTSFKLRIPGAENCLNVAASIEALSTLENQTWYYPFFHRLDFIITENGWDAFSPEVELKNLIDGSDSWRICSLNNEFKVRPFPCKY
ncbi:myotubularin-related protein 9-like isoform X1 [Rhopilema esculentum]|uniref:myotubularin-related protein 9-like isoform X1 n=1 Tax=Rhopilema esculentum TaxID=499914 RepID=UPI0031D1C23C